MEQYKTQLMIALGAILTSLLMGKFLKALILWPIVKFAKWTKWTKDDTLVEIAEKDLGIQEEINKLEGDKNDK